MPLILHTESNPEFQTYTEKALPNYQHLFTTENSFKEFEDRLSEVDVLDVFIYTSVTPDILLEMPNIKHINTRSTGFDHIHLGPKKIPLTNVPNYGQNTIAEHAFALLLCLSKRLRPQLKRTANKNFAYKDLLGFDLEGKTLGIIGTGNIGVHMIKIAKGFGLNVIAHDIEQKDFIPKILDYQYVSLEELLTRSDIISLHLPYNSHTRHLLDKSAFSKMKDGVVLINTSRGGLVDNQALLENLDNNKLSGVGLDVLEDEQLLIQGKSNPTLDRILDSNKVLFTPHTAYYTKEAILRIWETSAQNILKALEK